MKKIILCLLFLIYSIISFCQPSKLSQPSDSTKPFCIVTGINMQKLTITGKNVEEDNFITFKGNLDIISVVKNGDTVYTNYQKGKVTYSMKVVDKHTGTIRSGLVVIQR